MKLQEVNSKEVAFVFGRFNPPTIGHGKLLDTLASNSNYKIFASQTQDSKKNPLEYKTKLNFLSQQFPEHGKSIVKDASIKTIIDVMKSLQNEGYTDVTMVAGSDRAKSFETLLKKYNNKEYKFDSITVESAGIRDPDADGVEGASASKVRQAAANNDFATFKSMVPGGNNLAKAVFQATREGLKVNELAEAEQSKPIVFLDMDGVIADFFSEYAKAAGVKDGNYRKIPRNRINPTLNAMKGTDFFNKLPKITTADQLVNLAVRYTGGDYSILSSPLRGDKDNSARWKKEWLKREMNIQPRNVIITSNKSAYAVSNGVANILIDDHGSNIQKWNAAGGHGIKYQADEDSLQTVIDGLKAYETDRLDKRGN